MIEHIHQPPGTEVRCIGGHYTITEEGRMSHRGRILLFVVGVAIIDSSCCGMGGCRFIHVPGYVRVWQNQTRPDGLPVSTVEPIADTEDQKTIKAILDRQFPHSQVSFRED
jgi:hypothetical protein